MKEKSKKSRAELHLEFIKSLDESLKRTTVFNYTKHEPVDEEIDRVRSTRLSVKDLFKSGKRVGRVIAIDSGMITARDVNNQELFKVPSYGVKKL